jgi:hypothetical protein
MLKRERKPKKSDLEILNIFKLPKSKLSQITLFVILALVFISVIVLFFYLRGVPLTSNIPKEIDPVYTYYLSCIESQGELALNIMGQQGGYIEKSEFSAGSEYMPFSNELDFLGNGVPYWYYISGNGIVKEQIPTKAKMQSELNNFLDKRLNECDFSSFEEKGFNISLGEAKVSTDIEDNLVTVNVDQDLTIKSENSTWTKNTHSKKVSSRLGEFYNTAKKIYDDEKKTMFLENYGVDILRLYAPVDGSEVGCSPKIWEETNIRNDLINALEANTPAIKIKGNYYTLNNPDNKYFVHDIGETVNTNINFMYSKEWPTKMEVWPSEDGILRADPVGLQEGMGMLGFCYTTYHFVYDLAYPVMIQVYSGDELFQFPVVIFINKNKPRVPLDTEGLPDFVPELCDKKNKEMTVYTYNMNSEPIEAQIKFKCFDTSCNIGETKLSEDSSAAVLTDKFPQCVNGFVIASADGYEKGESQITSLDESEAEIYLKKLYPLQLVVTKTGRSVNYALVSITKNNKTTTINYPTQNQINLTEGQYEIKVYVYDNSSLNVQGGKTQKCVKVPKSGIMGLFGSEEEKCFDIEIPNQVISNAVSGGGTEDYYIGETGEEGLIGARQITINTPDFGKPTSLESLEKNYNSVDVSNLDVIIE